MAGHGPAPQDHRQRPRDEKAQPFDTLPAEGYQGEYPPLAAGYTLTIDSAEGPEEIDVEFLEATQDWYREWARSPMAVRFTAVDWGRLRRIVAPLADRYHRRPTTSIATELRLQETLLGATVMDRQRMRVRVATAAPAKRPGPVAAVSNIAEERKKRLRAEKPDG